MQIKVNQVKEVEMRSFGFSVALNPMTIVPVTERDLTGTGKAM